MKIIRLFVLSGWMLMIFPAVIQAQEGNIIVGELIIMLQHEISPRAFTQKSVMIQNQPVRISLKKTLVPSINVHLFEYDAHAFEPMAVLREVQSHPLVQLAQHNHHIERRNSLSTFPTDPGFGNQWGLHNTGQAGGTQDADIDAPEAWDLTTGGLSVLGDSIVIAIVDGGADLDHEDLVYWKNKGEIPANGIDDDANGYVDDYHGWNAFSDDDNIPSDLHGTLVSGIVAAKANNGAGGTGVSWGTPVLPVAASSTSEAIAVAGYGYVLAQRRRYNQTNGAEGAFIVVANSSFGVNYGQPANFPVWCAMFDSLGQEGVLSVVSTMNINANVDSVGDIPSACASPWVISVTNTTSTDVKRQAAAFGITSIDLGAPGTQIYSTIPNNNYGYDTGTSFSAPMVSGTLALMAAYACPGLMILYKNDPATAALVFKDYLLQSVDQLPSLQGIVASGGRLNAFNSLLMLQDSCGNFSDGCLPPFNLTTLTATDTSVKLSWTQIDSADQFTLRYRPLGDSIWSAGITASDTTYTLLGLSACTGYEFQVAAVCDTLFSEYFDTEIFYTEGCCEAPEAPSVISLTDSNVVLSWNGIYGATEYQFQYRQIPASFGPLVALTDTFLNLENLFACADYEVRVKALCDTSDNGFSTTTSFRTKGCGPCLDNTYCLSRGNDVSFEWLEEISVGPLLNHSGPNGGRGDFTASSYQLVIDSLYDFVLTPGYSGFAFAEAWRIWIDLNQDGEFTDSTERIFGTPTAISGQISGQLQIPAGTPPGNTRMRVSMRFGGFGGGTVPLPCDIFQEGEVEDYCVTLTNSDSILCQPPKSLIAQPVAGSDSVVFSWESSPDQPLYELQITDLAGGNTQILSTTDTFLITTLNGQCKDYQVKIRSLCGVVSSSYVGQFTYTTQGCGNCLDLAYCGVGGNSNPPVWIRTVQIGGMQHTSGSDNGYGDYTQISVTLPRGITDTFRIKPASTGTITPQYWGFWADWNQDGDFDDTDEEIFLSSSPSDSVNGSFSVPPNTDPGTVRLRVGMRESTFPGSCGSFGEGEWEDFCANITQGVGAEPDVSEPQIQVFPNPFSEVITINSYDLIREFSIMDMSGKILISRKDVKEQSIELNLNFLPRGLYILSAEGINGKKHIFLMHRI